MFERMTDRARRAIVLSQEEARLLNHNYIGTEHLLLGLVHEGEGVAALALRGLGVGFDAVRKEVDTLIGAGASTPSGHIPFTPRSKTVLEYSLREALQLGHNYIGTEHILLGLVREDDGVGMTVLRNLGVEPNQLRQQIITLLSGYRPAQAARSPKEQPHIGVPVAVCLEYVAWVVNYEDTFGPLSADHPLKQMKTYVKKLIGNE